MVNDGLLDAINVLSFCILSLNFVADVLFRRGLFLGLLWFRWFSPSSLVLCVVGATAPETAQDEHTYPSGPPQAQRS